MKNQNSGNSGAAAVKPVVNNGAATPSQPAGIGLPEGISLQDIVENVKGAEEFLGKSKEESTPPKEVAQDESETTESTDEPTEAAEPNEVTDPDEKENQEKETESGESPESEAENDESEESTEPEDEPLEVSEKIQKRFDKLTAQKKKEREEKEVALKERDAVKTENETLKAKLAEAQAGRIQIQPTPDSPLADVWKEDDVHARMQKAQEIKTWAMKHMHKGATVKAKDGTERFIEPEEVAEYLASADAVLTNHGPRRLQFLGAKKQMEQEAKTVYPALFNSSTQEYQQALEALKQFPWLLQSPNYALILGDALRGQKMRLDEAQKKSKPATPKLPAATAKAPPATTKQPVKVPLQKKDQSEKMKKLVDSGGDRNSLEALVESML